MANEFDISRIVQIRNSTGRFLTGKIALADQPVGVEVFLPGDGTLVEQETEFALATITIIIRSSVDGYIDHVVSSVNEYSCVSENNLQLLPYVNQQPTDDIQLTYLLGLDGESGLFGDPISRSLWLKP